MRYVALLRGVNVGGNRRVPNAEFQRVLEGLGFRDVITYINSGNAVFTSEYQPTASSVQAALERHFGFAIPTLVLPGERVKTIAESIPPEWTNESLKTDKSGHKSDVLYLFDELDVPDVLERLGYRPEVETMLHVDGAVLANITRVNQAKGSLQKLVGKKVYSQVTIRNISTAKKLAELVGA